LLSLLLLLWYPWVPAKKQQKQKTVSEVTGLVSMEQREPNARALGDRARFRPAEKTFISY
jgi:hypothetical protein